MSKHIFFLWMVVALMAGDRLVASLEAQPVKPPIPAVAGPTTAAQFATVVPIIDPLKVGAVIENKGGACQSAPITAGVVTFNLATGATNFCTTHDANLTGIVVSNCQGPMTSFNWWLASDGAAHVDSTAMWSAANIFFQNGIPPIFNQTVNNLDVLSFKSKNSCATWQGSISINFPGGP